MRGEGEERERGEERGEKREERERGEGRGKGERGGEGEVIEHTCKRIFEKRQFISSNCKFCIQLEDKGTHIIHIHRHSQHLLPLINRAAQDDAVLRTHGTHNTSETCLSFDKTEEIQPMDNILHMNTDPTGQSKMTPCGLLLLV